MKKLGWNLGASIVLALTAQATIAQTTSETEVYVQEPAFKSQDKPLIPGGKETRIPYSPVPIFRQRLANSLEQIDTGVSKGWITNDAAANLKQQSNEIAPLIDKIKDAKGTDKPLVDQVESKLTALNAAVFASFNKKETTPPPKVEVKAKVATPPSKEKAKTTKATSQKQTKSVK